MAVTSEAGEERRDGVREEFSYSDAPTFTDICKQFSEIFRGGGKTLRVSSLKCYAFGKWQTQRQTKLRSLLRYFKKVFLSRPCLKFKATFL